MLIVCFFCKQKTAYEMRISDWSSDVCSSDLATVAAVLGVLLEHGMAGGAGAREAVEDDGVFVRGDLQDALDQTGGLRRDEHVVGGIEVDQLGIASCRERVCQYV